MSDSDIGYTPEPGLPLLWQAMRAIESLGLPMVEKLYWYQGTTIEALYRLAQRSPADRVQIIRCLEILERQTEGITPVDRCALDDAMVKADRLADIARMRAAKERG